jgi:hypothetical protein
MSFMWADVLLFFFQKLHYEIDGARIGSFFPN